MAKLKQKYNFNNEKELFVYNWKTVFIIFRLKKNWFNYDHVMIIIKFNESAYKIKYYRKKFYN